MKLLIVDDSAMIRRTISAAYKNSVFTEVDTAPDGVLALAKFKQMMPDVVTLDITMPHMDGLTALTEMLEVNPDATILTISALADYHTAIESLTLGADQFICKPFKQEDLLEALDNIIKVKNTTPHSLSDQQIQTALEQSYDVEGSKTDPDNSKAGCEESENI